MPAGKSMARTAAAELGERTLFDIFTVAIEREREAGAGPTGAVSHRGSVTRPSHDTWEGKGRTCML